MASMTIRDLEPERDAPVLAALAQEVMPANTITVASWLHRLQSLPERSARRSWVAEWDGEIAGYVQVFRQTWGEHGYLGVSVRGQYRRRGIGSALYDAAVGYADSLEAPMITSYFHENAEGVAFARARGFAEARAEQVAVVDPRTVTEAPTAEVRSFVHADMRDAHRIDEAATRDLPQLEPVDAIPYDEWEQWVLEHPLFTREGSFIAYANGQAGAVSMLIADPASGRATNMFTGTLPELRGRGLALAAKLASNHWAAENGITQIATTNDETNAPMLAINRRLGYRAAGRRVEFSRAV
jgi:GNAT superfamily N-acetyltransferase